MKRQDYGHLVYLIWGEDDVLPRSFDLCGRCATAFRAWVNPPKGEPA